VQANVEEGKKPEHSAKTNEPRLVDGSAQGADAERDYQKVQRPLAGGCLNCFYGISAQVLVKAVPQQMQERAKAQEKYWRLDPLDRGIERFHRVRRQ
jgi:hypothetical protein